MAGCDPSGFGDYSTLASLTQSSDSAPTNLTARYTGVGSVTLTWTPPGDYATNPENYLGFFILKNFKAYGSSDPPVAPTMYNDPATPYAVPVYVGRNSQMGEAAGLTDTFEQCFSDVNAGPGFSYAYSIFVIKSDLTYSVAASLIADVPAGDGSTLLINETFVGATISGNDITSGMSSNGLDFRTDHPESTSIATIGRAAGQQAVKLQGSTTKGGATISSDIIPSGSANFEPNTLYAIRFWTRSSYDSSTYLGSDEDQAANALSGILTLDTPNWNVLQQYQVLHQEDLPESTPTTRNVCTTDLTKRVAAYDFGGTPPSFKYLGAAFNGVWTEHGMVFLTGGETTDLPSTQLNKYGASGNPTQKYVTGGPASTSQNLRLTFNLGEIDTTAWSDPSKISAELGQIIISKGVFLGQTQYERVLSETPLNFVLNPDFSFDTTTTAVEPVGSLPGYAPNAMFCPATESWVLNNGRFSYNPTADFFYVTMKPTCASPAGESSTLSQDIWYLSLIAGQTYEISFEVIMNPNNMQEQICTGQAGDYCHATDAVSELQVDILNSAKNPVGTFSTLSLSGGTATPTGFSAGAGAQLTATQVATGKTGATFDEATCTASDPLVGGWLPVTYEYVVPSMASAYRNLSPTLKFTMAKDVIGADPYWAIRNISIKPKAADITAGKIAVQGFDMPNPIPTTPSSISGTTTTPSNVQTWDFTTMDIGGPTSGTPVLPQLAGLNGASVGPSGPNKVGGMLVLNQKDSNPANLSVVVDNVSPVTGGNVLCITCNSGSDGNAPSGAVLNTSEYFTSGVFDCWVKVANVLKNGSQVTGNQPVGFTFASWVFSYQDYNQTYDSREMLQFGVDRNPEIDIEIGGNCPKGLDNDEFKYSIGRLNTWGGVLSGTGGNLELHAEMPDSLNLATESPANNGYHKLTIVLNAGADSASPSNSHDTRTPGYIKWYVNDKFWGGGWLGGQYGTDNVPHTGMRFTVGPWYPTAGWAGSLKDSDDNYIWDTADFYMTKMSYTPLYDNGATDDTNYLIPPTQGSPSVGPFPNRDFYLPEFNPFNHFDPTCTDVVGAEEAMEAAEAPETAAASEESEDPSFLDNVKGVIDKFNPFSSSEEEGV